MKMGNIKGIAIALLTFVITNYSTAGEVEKSNGSGWNITSRTVDTKLPASDARIKFTFIHPENGASKQNITLSYGGKQKTVATNVQGVNSLAIKPGKYTFTVIQAKCDTIIEKIEVKSRERIDITVAFSFYGVVQVAEKPIIYLYPEVNTNVEVKVKPTGKFILTYPKYNNGWNVLVKPDGTIETNGKKYNYLFWEANFTYVQAQNKNVGFMVKQDSLLNFLETSLTSIGLNTKEQQDFITFWYPQMMNNENTFIHFMFNDDCNAVANLEITPAPTSILRVYMVWKNAKGLENMEIEQQNFPSFTRKGFSVIEWGGSEIQSNTELSEN